MKRKLLIPSLAVTLVLALALTALLLTTNVLSKAVAESVFSGGAPSGLCKTEGGLLIADGYYKVLWQLRDGEAERFAGASEEPDYTGEPLAAYRDGARLEGAFGSPWAVAPYLEGYAVTDSVNHTVRYVDGETVRTVAGVGAPGYMDARGTMAALDYPTGLAAGEDGCLYIADTGNDCIRRLDDQGNVTTYLDDQAGLRAPTGLCWANGVLYIADSGNHRLCRYANGTLTALAGGVEGQSDEEGAFEGGYRDGPAASARFSGPQGIAVGENGDIYIADTGNGALRLLTDGQVYTLLAVEPGETALWPVSPRGLLADGAALYAADSFAGQVLKLYPADLERSQAGTDAP